MVNLSNNLQIKCNTCDNEVRVIPNLAHETTIQERAMGEEIIHDFFVEFFCENCNSKIEINIRISEYPMCSYNYDKCKCNGGTFIKQPEFTVEP